MGLDSSHSVLDLELAYQRAEEEPPTLLQPIIDTHKRIVDKVGQEKYQTCLNLIGDVIKSLKQSKQTFKELDDQIKDFKVYMSTIDNHFNEHDLSLTNEIHTKLNLMKRNIQEYYEICNDKIFRFKRMKTKFGLYTIPHQMSSFYGDLRQQKSEMDTHVRDITSSLSRLGITERALEDIHTLFD
jgi:hypothetical protein